MILLIGEQLRQKREQYGWSLKDVAQHLRIRTSILEALEKGERDLLPSLTFAKGFAQSYADFLGLDAHALAQDFEREWYAQEREELRVTAPPQRESADHASFFRGPISIPIVGLAGLLFAGLWFSYGYINSPEQITLWQDGGDGELYDRFRLPSVQDALDIQKEETNQISEEKNEGQNEGQNENVSPTGKIKTTSVNATTTLHQNQKEQKNVVRNTAHSHLDQSETLTTKSLMTNTAKNSPLATTRTTRISIVAERKLKLIVYKGDVISTTINLGKGVRQALPEGREYLLMIELPEQESTADDTEEKQLSYWREVGLIVDGWEVGTLTEPASPAKNKLILDAYDIVTGVPQWSLR